MANEKDIIRDEQIRIRVTAIEKLAIKNKAEQCNLTMSEYCRDSALNKKIEFALSDEEIEIFLFFKENFRGLKYIKNSWKVPQDLKVEIEKVLEDFKDLRDRFQ